MVPLCLVLIFIAILILMERKGIIDEGEFAVGIVFTLLAVAGYMGIG
ncbi:membrane protein [Serratia nematodiphila DZ0503SBS1]|nr:membrane protein [Serratia nematodiphila DZ0503SBS1]